MTAVRLASYKRDQSITIEVDGQQIPSYEGETVATAMLAAGYSALASPAEADLPTGRLFCGMGVCMQCLVTIDGHPSLRACQTPVQPGMKVETRR